MGRVKGRYDWSGALGAIAIVVASLVVMLLGIWVLLELGKEWVLWLQ